MEAAEHSTDRNSRFLQLKYPFSYGPDFLVGVLRIRKRPDVIFAPPIITSVMASDKTDVVYKFPVHKGVIE